MKEIVFSPKLTLSVIHRGELFVKYEPWSPFNYKKWNLGNNFIHKGSQSQIFQCSKFYGNIQYSLQTTFLIQLWLLPYLMELCALTLFYLQIKGLTSLDKVLVYSLSDHLTAYVPALHMLSCILLYNKYKLSMTLFF